MAATIDEVIDALLDNADFEESDSLTKARTFITAANRYFILTPANQADQGSSMAMGLTQIQALLNRATAFVKNSAATSVQNSSVRFLSVSEGFR